MRSKIHIILILTLSLVGLVLPYVASAGISFYGFEQSLNNEWEMVGEAEIISDNPHSGEYCLKLGAMGRATLPVSDNNVYGRVSFWVKDSMVQFPTSDSASIGPVFGLQNKDGNMLLFGILRRSWLSGTKYGYLLTAENNFYNLRNFGVFPYINRTGEWQKWTIEVSGPGVINVYVNNKLKTISDSVKQYFSKGFTEVYFRGDDPVGPEEFHFDEVTVEVSGEVQTDPHEFPEPQAITNVLRDPNFFPIAVWAQPLVFTDYFKALGVNIFIGEILQFGPTTQKQFLDGLYSKGLYGIVHPAKIQDEVDPEVISQFKKHPALLAWRHRDEPDILSKVKPGFKSPPWEIKELYDEIGALDLEHSVYLNFGAGVGDPTRRHAQTTDYYEYCEGADIISYDIYPISTYPNGEKLLYSVADGIDRLKNWSNNKKPIWIWLEASDLGGDNRPPTPQEMRAEVWMTIIHGADGIGWFPHVFNPFFWHDIPPELEVEMKNIAQTLKALAPVINSSERDDVQVRMLIQGRIDVSSRIDDNKLYFFTVNMMNKEVDAEFILPAQYSNSKFKVINEDRTIEISQGVFAEHFTPYEVHLYEEISEALIYGDVSGKGTISAYDASLIIQGVDKNYCNGQTCRSEDRRQ
ncbi:MAG: glycoside hydrolase 5 family protein [Planctomycetota bacterium]